MQRDCTGLNAYVVFPSCGRSNRNRTQPLPRFLFVILRRLFRRRHSRSRVVSLDCSVATRDDRRRLDGTVSVTRSTKRVDRQLIVQTHPVKSAALNRYASRRLARIRTTPMASFREGSTCAHSLRRDVFAAAPP